MIKNHIFLTNYLFPTFRTHVLDFFEEVSTVTYTSKCNNKGNYLYTMYHNNQ